MWKPFRTKNADDGADLKDVQQFKLTKFSVSKKLLIIVVLVGLLCIVVCGALWKINQNELPPKNQVTIEEKRLEDAKKEPAPTTDREKYTYYSQIAAAYYDTGDYQAALDNMLKADSFIKDRSVDGGLSANIPIARYYEKLGNKLKAREYWQREIDRAKTAPDNQQVIDYLTKSKDEIK